MSAWQQLEYRIAELELFVEQHPGHALVDVALWQIARLLSKLCMTPRYDV